MPENTSTNHGALGSNPAAPTPPNPAKTLEIPAAPGAPEGLRSRSVHGDAPVTDGPPFTFLPAIGSGPAGEDDSGAAPASEPGAPAPGGSGDQRNAPPPAFSFPVHAARVVAPGARPVAPELRRCAERIVDADGVPSDCDCALGPDAPGASCACCGGAKCNVHCPSTSHVPGAQLLATETGDGAWGWRLWRVNVDHAQPRFVGEVLCFSNGGGRPRIMVVEKGAACDEVKARAERTYRRMVEGEPAGAPYAPPTVREISADEAKRMLRARAPGLAAGLGVYAKRPPVPRDRCNRYPACQHGANHPEPCSDADRGDETCSEADAFDVERWSHVRLDQVAGALHVAFIAAGDGGQATRLTRDLEALLLNASHAWGELEELIDGSTLSPHQVLVKARRLSEAVTAAALCTLAGLR